MTALFTFGICAIIFVFCMIGVRHSGPGEAIPYTIGMLISLTGCVGAIIMLAASLIGS